MAVIPREVRYYQNPKGNIPYLNWFSSLRDENVKNVVRVRLDRISLGNFGDHKSVGQGVIELRFTIGSGCRIYLGQDGKELVILLCGGDKSSQAKDIKMAKEFWVDYKRRAK